MCQLLEHRVCQGSVRPRLRVRALLSRAVSSSDLPALEDMCKEIIKERQPFERLEVSKDVLLDMFKVS